jgi:hypothetical protein
MTVLTVRHLVVELVSPHPLLFPSLRRPTGHIRVLTDTLGLDNDSTNANSHTPCHARAVLLKVYFVSFPYDLHRATVVNSHMSCRAHAVLRPCRFESDFSRPRQSTAWTQHGHGMACVN